MRDSKLAVYGTLAPSRVNHHQLDGLAGDWTPGTVYGRLVATGWGQYLGFPAIVLDPAADEVAVQVFASADLPRHRVRLDAFEGEAYRRAPVEVATATGVVAAWIYVSAGEP